MFMQKFPKYILNHDHIECVVNSIVYRAEVEFDSYYDIAGDDCWDEEDLRRYNIGEWCFGEIRIFAHVGNVSLGLVAATLGGIAINYSDESNNYASDECNDMLPEAIDNVQRVVKDLIEELKKVSL